VGAPGSNPADPPVRGRIHNFSSEFPASGPRFRTGSVEFTTEVVNSPADVEPVETPLRYGEGVTVGSVGVGVSVIGGGGS